MKIKKKFFLRLSIIFLFVIGGIAVQGQISPGDPCGDPTDPCCAPDGFYNPGYDPACPIDGGVVALLAAGVGYGLKRVRDSRKQKQAAE